MHRLRNVSGTDGFGLNKFKWAEGDLALFYDKPLTDGGELYFGRISELKRGDSRSQVDDTRTQYTLQFRVGQEEREVWTLFLPPGRAIAEVGVPQRDDIPSTEIDLPKINRLLPRNVGSFRDIYASHAHAGRLAVRQGLREAIPVKSYRDLYMEVLGLNRSL